MSHSPTTQPDTEAGEAIRSAARRVLTNANVAIEDRARPDTKSIHDFRRCIKRWRALLFLAVPFIGADVNALKADARDMAHALGGARDAQSALDALTDLSEHGLTLSERSQKTLRTRIDEVRHAAEATTLTDDTRKQLVRTLNRSLGNVEHWPLHSVMFTDIAERLAAGYRAARRAAPKNWSDAEGEVLQSVSQRGN